jgi:acetate kinase
VTSRFILTLNSGSSSIKFALFESGSGLEEHMRGEIDGIGALPRIRARAGDQQIANQLLESDEAADHATALRLVMRLLDKRSAMAPIAAVAHRIVHGGAAFTEPIVLDHDKVARLAALVPLAPLHQPHNLAGVRGAQDAFPDAIQIACFDTAFHRTHDWVNDTYALPTEYYERGIRRYGFHGLSYEHVIERLRAIAPEPANGRVAVMHLGNGASVCAIKDGRSIASSMGFTPLDGLPMGTRSGQLDPGVVLYLLDELHMTPHDVADLLYRRSGLKGLSGLSNDMRQLEASNAPQARKAIDYFVHYARRELGAMTAILSGLDALVFSGGIGENAWRIRERICSGFEWLGLALDDACNRAGETIVSGENSRVLIAVIHTDEEKMMARHAARLLADEERRSSESKTSA